MNALVALPILIPMAAAIGALAAAGSRRVSRLLGIVAVFANVLAATELLRRTLSDGATVLVSQAGAWAAPFGISIVVDPLAALLLLTTSLVGAGVFVYSLDERPARLTDGFFHPLFHALILGVQWSLVTGDLFNLFVAFEIMLMASYGLLVHAGGREQIRFANQYVLMNLLGSTLFVTAAGLLYGHVGTLNFADLARIARSNAWPASATPVAGVLLIAFAMKSAIFPLWSWLPRSYAPLPPVILALFGGLLTKVGLYVLLRVFVMTLGPAAQPFATPLLIVAMISMLLGGLAAAAGTTVRQILAVGILSQMGYLAAGVGLALSLATLVGRVEATAATIFFLLHNMLVKTALFLCGGSVKRLCGSDDLDRTGGLAKATPLLATLFFIAAMSLAGLPPFSGFFGKLVLVREAFQGKQFLLGGVIVGTGVLTLLTMLKVWTAVFWSERPKTFRRQKRGSFGSVAAAVLVIATLSMGLLAGHWYRLCQAAARIVIEPTPYVNAVLGEGAAL